MTGRRIRDDGKVDPAHLENLTTSMRGAIEDAWTYSGLFGELVDRDRDALYRLIDSGIKSPYRGRWEVVSSLLTAAYADVRGNSGLQILAANEGIAAIDRAAMPKGGMIEAVLRYHQARAAFRSGDIVASAGPALRYAEIVGTTKSPWRAVLDHQIFAQLAYVHGQAINTPWILSLSGTVPISLRQDVEAKRKLFVARAAEAARYAGYGPSFTAGVLPGAGVLIGQIDPTTATDILGNMLPSELSAVVQIPAVFGALEADFPARAIKTSGKPRDYAERLYWIGECLSEAGHMFAAGDFSGANGAGRAAMSLTDDTLAVSLIDYAIDTSLLDTDLDDRTRSKMSARAAVFEMVLHDVSGAFFADRQTGNPNLLSLAGAGSLLLSPESGVTALEAFERLASPNSVAHLIKRAGEFSEVKVYFKERGQSWKEAQRDIAVVLNLIRFLPAGLKARLAGDLKAEASLARDFDQAITPAFRSAYTVICGGNREGTEEVCREFDRSLGPAADATAWKTAERFVSALSSNQQALIAYRANDARSVQRYAEEAGRRGRDLAKSLGAEPSWSAGMASADLRGLIEANFAVASKIALTYSSGNTSRDAELLRLSLQTTPNVKPQGYNELDAEDKKRVDTFADARSILADALAGLPAPGSPERTLATRRYRSLLSIISDGAAKDRYFWEDLQIDPRSVDENWFDVSYRIPLLGQLLPMAERLTASASVVLSDIRAAGGTEEINFVAQVIGAAFAGLPAEIPDPVRDEANGWLAGGPMLEFILNNVIPIANSVDRPDIAYRASRTLSLIAAETVGNETMQTASEGFRHARQTYGAELRLLASRPAGKLTSIEGARIVELADLGNRSTTGIDHFERLQMQTAPAPVREAYARYINAKLRSEALAGLRLVAAGEDFKRISSRTLAKPDGADVQALEALVRSIRSPQADLDKHWRSWQLAMQDAGMSYSKTVNLSAAAASLKSDEILISGYAFSDLIVMFAIFPDGSLKIWPAANVNNGVLHYQSVRDLADRYRKGLTVLAGGQIPRFDQAASKDLYTALFGYAAPDVSKAERIVWVAPRHLDDFPISALLTGNAAGDQLYLGLEKEIMSPPSILSFIAMRQTASTAVRPQTGASLFVGDIEFSGKATNTASAQSAPKPGAVLGKSLGRLREPSSLLETFRKEVHEPVLLRREDAQRSNVLARAATPLDTVVFYTHGVGNAFTRACGAASLQALALHQGRSETSCASALLTPEDVVSSGLKADLVVLAACSTGAAPVITEAPLSGLARAFLVAGSGSVVTAQFEVIDVSALLLTEKLIRARHKGGMGPSAAMRSAMRELARTPGYGDPVHWALFEVVGEGADKP
ncbi:MAG TPA: CHAT domain-containing protein [Hyphomonas sp.]|nr:CHAT domain-containing protein [Hyphomonas sp.]